MPAATDLDRLEYLLELIELVENDLGGYSRERFLSRRNVYDLTAYRLGTIGETAQRLSDHLKRTKPMVPWLSLYAFRNLVAHDYRSINPERVWVIATENLSELASACRALRDELSDSA